MDTVSIALAYCIDNLPAGLISHFLDLAQQENSHVDQVAIGIDARNLHSDKQHFYNLIMALREAKVEYKIIFLDASDSKLIQRLNHAYPCRYSNLNQYPLWRRLFCFCKNAFHSKS